MSQFVRSIFAAVLTSFVGWYASGVTWQVQKDGSGDFTVIQDALDIAAPGDTIKIGPGQFDDFQIEEFSLGGTGAAIMVPRAGPLTVIGAGRDLTKVGAATYTVEHQGFSTCGLAQDANPPWMLVKGITFQNVDWPVILHGPVEMRNCRFEGGGSANVAIDSAVGCTFTNCEFIGRTPSAPSAIATFVGGVNDSLKITDSQFYLGVGVKADGIQGLELEGCEFSSVAAPIILIGSSGTVRKCRADMTTTNAVLNLNDSSVSVMDSRFGTGVFFTVFTTGQCELIASNSVFAGAPVSTIDLTATSAATIHGCDILNGGGLSINAETDASLYPVLDITGNYWGSVDSTEIASWIYDGNDPPDKPWSRTIVDFSGFKNSTVPTRSRSLGSLKADF